jgi:hypothetical protein
VFVGSIPKESAEQIAELALQVLEREEAASHPAPAEAPAA